MCISMCALPNSHWQSSAPPAGPLQALAASHQCRMWAGSCPAWTVGAACWPPFAVHPLDMSYFSAQKLVATDIFYEMGSHLYLRLAWTQIFLPLKCWPRVLAYRFVPPHLLQKDLFKRPSLLSPSKCTSLPSKTLSLTPQPYRSAPIISVSHPTVPLPLSL